MRADWLLRSELRGGREEEYLCEVSHFADDVLVILRDGKNPFLHNPFDSISEGRGFDSWGFNFTVDEIG